ncbi:MAG: ABC transporter permease [Clostridia bacterium]|nr:ABC transporter permease [Clostridia bacterium]
MEKEMQTTFIRRLMKKKNTTIFLVLVGMCLILGLANKSFFNYENLASVARATAYTAILSIGELLVILICGIDLSVGSICGLAAVSSALMVARMGWAMIPAILVGLASGLLVGAVNGALVVGLKLPPFIATMGTTQIINSVALLLTDGKPVLGLGEDFLYIGQGKFLYLPIAMWIMIVVAIVASLFLNKTVTGRNLYALGGGEEAARFSGIRINLLKMITYVISGFAAAMCGVILCARMGSAQGATGAGYQMDAIASCVIGGASMAGGEGNVSGTIIGAGIMCVIRNALVMLSVSTYWQSMIIGFIIIAAVTIDQFRRASANRVQKALVAEATAERD